MLKAEQTNLAHSTNVNIVGLRQLEINYFATFYNNFGTQSALVASFVLNSLAQTPALAATCNAFWKYWFWCTEAVAFVTSVHMLLTCVYCSIYAQGLALRGPTGSMVRSVEGMVEEQHNVLYVFVVCVTALTFNLFGVFFVLMYYRGAVSCTILLLLSMFFWYRSANRIYNRFKFEQTTENYRFNENEILSYRIKGAVDESNVKSANSSKQSKERSHSVPDGVHFAANITVKVKGAVFGDPWKRRYAVIRGSELLMYSDKHSFEALPDSPLSRGVGLEGLRVEVDSQEPPFTLRLLGDGEDVIIEFRCDTVAELTSWTEELQRGIERASHNIFESKSSTGSSR